MRFVSMKRISMILSCLVTLYVVADVSAQGRRSQRRQVNWSHNTADQSATMPQSTGANRATTAEESATNVATNKNLQGVDDAMDEVNAKRAMKGLPPLRKDPLLSKAALACAKQRAARNIHGHLPESDFSYLPSGASATVGGCGALDDSWGWETCAYDSLQYTIGGAAWVRGPGGLRFMHFFAR